MVKRREGGRDLTARFKADMSSKLFSVGKGFERKGEGDAERTTLNINADYLTAASGRVAPTATRRAAVSTIRVRSTTRNPTRTSTTVWEAPSSATSRITTARSSPRRSP